MYPGYGRWTAATLLVIAGLFLSSLRPLAPDWVSIVAANALIVISTVLYMEGAREFRGLAPRVWFVYPAGAAAIGAVAYFDYIVRSLNARVAVMSSFIAATLMLASVTLFKNLPSGRTLAVRLIGSLFCGTAIVLWARGLYFIVAPPARDVFALSGVNSLYYAGVLVCVTGFTLGFVLLADEKIMGELQRSKSELVAIANHLKDSNRALERSNSELESFAYATTHDLQEPLRTVSLYAQLLQKHPADVSRDFYLQTMVTAAGHMEQLIQGMLEYSRVSREPLASSERVDLNEVLAAVEENLSAQILESRATIAHSSLPTLAGSRLQLIRLMQNLIQNSIKHRCAERACRVEVRSCRQGEHWVIAVQDNGVGFKPEYRQYIFGMFKRLDRVRAGAGLGLAMCRAIVERHGGTIWAEAEEGLGATFYFTWPLAPVPTASSNGARQEGVPAPPDADPPVFYRHNRGVLQ
jgi:signal transduction histidine kinase